MYHLPEKLIPDDGQFFASRSTYQRRYFVRIPYDFGWNQTTETRSMAAIGWFALSSCLGTNVRRSLATNARRYTPGTGWSDLDTIPGQEWELETLRSSRVR
jgi:hypothetical protein